MKALFIPKEDFFSIELIAETPEEREMLITNWGKNSLSIGCEEWRELASSSHKLRGEENPNV